MTDRRLKAAILLSWMLLSLNVVLAAAALAGFWWYIGLTRMHIVGAYRDLDTRGVIDHDAIRQHFGARLADDWFLVATEYLTGDLLARTMRFAVVVAMFFLINAIVSTFLVACLFRRSRAYNGSVSS